MKASIRAAARNLADVTAEHPQRRMEGALRLSRYILDVDALALTLISPFDQKPRLVAHDGYDPGVVDVYTEDWFGVTDRRLNRHRRDPGRLYPWDCSEFADTPYASETLMPAGYRNGITRPLISSEGRIFGFVHTNITKPRFESETQDLIRETVDQLAQTAWSLHVRMSTRLTEREREILGLIREGCSTPEIATRLYISPRTVATHIDHVLRKTRTENRAQAAAWAVRYGF